MLAGKAYMERHNQVAGIVYRNICTEYGLEVPGSRWETPPKVVENKQAKILWDFQIQTVKMVVVDKHRKTVVVIDVAIPNDSNIRKKEHKKLEKYQGLKEEMERMWGMKAIVVPVVIGTLGKVTAPLPLLALMDSPITIVDSFRFLGTTITLSGSQPSAPSSRRPSKGCSSYGS
ncbi:hypothetical protein D4764_18G0000380 [Takifugu flavidus]|uniref:Uncharacterized protein n=1 Tax=Takifugu flavidus TaxID=433684 RepID=A0A5C6NNP3_9TELE|nr:hypothetical protein D4764_18G0000380 [Takifugu flavidus]